VPVKNTCRTPFHQRGRGVHDALALVLRRRFGFSAGDVRSNREFEHGHAVQVHAVVFGFVRRTVGTKHPLLSHHLPQR
jgi:hypothetical protein